MEWSVLLSIKLSNTHKLRNFLCEKVLKIKFHLFNKDANKKFVIRRGKSSNKVAKLTKVNSQKILTFSWADTTSSISPLSLN